jgi:hypothetical protein
MYLILFIEILIKIIMEPNLGERNTYHRMEGLLAKTPSILVDCMSVHFA